MVHIPLAVPHDLPPPMKSFEAHRISQFDGSLCIEPGCSLLAWTEEYCSIHAREHSQLRLVDDKIQVVKVRHSKGCLVEGCEERHHSRGRCLYHYYHWRYERQKQAGVVVGTRLSKQSQELLKELDITYNQLRQWAAHGWMKGSLRNLDVERLTYLAQASKLRKNFKGMTIPDIADQLEKEDGK